MQRISLSILKGKLISLIPLEEHHLVDVLEIVEDGKLYHQPGMFAGPYPEEIPEWYQISISEQAEGKRLCYLAQDNVTGTILGSIQLKEISTKHLSGEIGSLFFKKSAHKTFANTESCFLLLQYGFEILKLIRLTWISGITNFAACKAALRLGFKFEGTNRNLLIGDFGEKIDCNLYSLTDYDWPNVKLYLRYLIEEKYI